MPKKNHSSTSDYSGQATAKANPDPVLDQSVSIRVKNVQELYEAVEDPHHVGARILLRKRFRPPQTYVLTRRLLLQRDMKLIGITGNASEILIDTRALTAAELVDGVRFSSIGVGLGANAVEWLTIIGNPLAAGGIGADLPGTDPTTIRIANVVSGESSGAFNSRGIDIRNLNRRKVTVEIENCEFFGQTAGIRFANFQGVEGAEIHAEMRNNRSHGNKVGCLIINNSALNSRIEVSSNLDTFDDNGAGCGIYGGASDASENNFARLEAKDSRFVNNRRTPGDLDLGGVVAIGGRVPDNQSVASKNKVELRIEDCTIENNQNPNFAAYGARNSATTNPTVAGTHNTVFIELFGGNTLTQVTEIPSDPTEATPTNKVKVVRGSLNP